jgi:hypothetical protein
MIDKILRDLMDKANHLGYKRDIIREKHNVELKCIDEQRQLLSDLIHNINNYKNKLLENVEEKPSMGEVECCFNCFYFVKIDGGCLKNNIPKPSDYAVNLKTFKCDYFKSIINKF